MLLKEQKPLVQAYVMDQIFDKMANGDGVAGAVLRGRCGHACGG